MRISDWSSDVCSSDLARMLIDDGWLSRSDLELLALSENTGGAGGFAAGMQAVAERGAPWVWVMDDDACPYEDALELIYAAAEDPNCMYGSVTIQNDRLAWHMKASDRKSTRLNSSH